MKLKKGEDFAYNSNLGSAYKIMYNIFIFTKTIYYL